MTNNTEERPVQINNNIIDVVRITRTNTNYDRIHTKAEIDRRITLGWTSFRSLNSYSNRNSAPKIENFRSVRLPILTYASEKTNIEKSKLYKAK